MGFQTLALREGAHNVLNLAYYFTAQIIIVDDGSKDSTFQVAKNWYAKHREAYRVISLVKNQGKGGAVKVGVSEALGKTILMVMQAPSPAMCIPRFFLSLVLR